LEPAKQRLLNCLTHLRRRDPVRNVIPPKPLNATQLQAPIDDIEANTRADWWEFDDPFSDIFPSLLTASQIANYARVTGLVHPFDEAFLKGATYEVGISGCAYWWDQNNKKHVDVVSTNTDEIVLSPNSITFVETDIDFRLPQYIAARFNLHIKLVHRGLLLGTGPIVDPGFRGKLLIPLHNLTSSPYTITAGEKIVWVEFSKTLFGSTSADEGYLNHPLKFRVFPESKRWLRAPQYLTKSNAGNPIVSSISGFIGDVEQRVQAVESRVRTLQILAYIGIILTVILSLYSSWSLYNSALDIIKAYEVGEDSLESRVERLERCRNQLPGIACK
jgi:deoxycytidine triphosphate deaminase